MIRTLLARAGLIPPVLQERAKGVKATLTACEDYALQARDPELMRLLAAHHQALHAIALAAPGGIVNVEPLSGGGPKQIPAAGEN
jgi:hypothetical protein